MRAEALTDWARSFLSEQWARHEGAAALAKLPLLQKFGAHGAADAADVLRTVMHFMQVQRTSSMRLGESFSLARNNRQGNRPLMLATFTVDPSAILLGRETIYRDGERVGWLTSGGYGYSIARSIGYGYVRRPAGVTAEWVLAGSYELEVAGERVPAHVALQPLYDPTNARVKA